MAELTNLPSPGETCTEQDWEQIHGFKRGGKLQLCGGKRGGVFFGPVSDFPCEERGGAERDHCTRRKKLDLNEPVVLCRDLPLNAAPSRDSVLLEPMTWII